MTKAGEIFRTFFDSDEDYVHFKYAVRVETIENMPEAHAVCTRSDPTAHPESRQGKPALVMVYEHGPVEAEIKWISRSLHHRKLGPAQVIVFRDGRIVGNWYTHGVRTDGPTRIRSIASTTP